MEDKSPKMRESMRRAWRERHKHVNQFYTWNRHEFVKIPSPSTITEKNITKASAFPCILSADHNDNVKEFLPLKVS